MPQRRGVARALDAEPRPRGQVAARDAPPSIELTLGRNGAMPVSMKKTAMRPRLVGSGARPGPRPARAGSVPPVSKHVTPMNPPTAAHETSPAWRAALERFDDDLRRRGARRRPASAYGADLRQFAAWATAPGAEPSAVTPALLRRYAAALSERRLARPPSRASSPPCARSSGRCASTATSREPGRPAGGAEAPPSFRTCCAPEEIAACWTASPPRRRWSCATARCSSSPTPAACAPRSSSTWTSARSTSTPSSCASRARARKTRMVPAGEPALRALARYLERARAALAGGPGEPALFLSKSGRRLSTSDVRRRLSVWARHAAMQGGVAPARAAPLVRDASVGGRCGPARDPGVARPRIRVHDPDLHSGRVGAPEGRVFARTSAGLRRHGNQRQSHRAEGPLAPLQARR